MITYQIDHDAHLVTCRVTIAIRVLDVGNLIEQLFADPRFDGGFNTLVVVGDATIAPDLNARNTLARLLLSWRELCAATKWGLVLPSSAWRRIAGQLIDDYGLALRNVRCFSESAAALIWFGESRRA